jgi:hypothetical protein
VAEDSHDIQVIKKAVKKNLSYKPGQEVKWFKLLITDNRTRKAKLRMKLPVALIEYFLKCAEDKHMRITRSDCEVDLKSLFQDLKKLGPMSVLEIYDEGVTLKVWFE